jgi:hypothetical protein
MIGAQRYHLKSYILSQVGYFYFTKKITEKFIKEKISGWDVFAVDVLGKEGELYTGYYGLSIHGRCSPIDFCRSLVVYRDFPGGSFPVFKGRYFENDNWDGSVFFMEGTGGAGGFKYCSNRVKKIVDEEKIKLTMMESLTETEIDVHIIRTVSPDKVPKGI